MICISHSQMSFRNASLVAVNKIFVHVHTCLPNRWISCSAVSKISRSFIAFIPVRIWGRIVKFLSYILCSFYNCVSYVPTVNIYLCPSYWCMRFHADYGIMIISVVRCIIFCHCFHVFHCCTCCFLLLQTHGILHLLLCNLVHCDSFL